MSFENRICRSYCKLDMECPHRQLTTYKDLEQKKLTVLRVSWTAKSRSLNRLCPQQAHSSQQAQHMLHLFQRNQHHPAPGGSQNLLAAMLAAKRGF